MLFPLHLQLHIIQPCSATQHYHKYDMKDKPFNFFPSASMKPREDLSTFVLVQVCSQKGGTKGLGNRDAKFPGILRAGILGILWEYWEFSEIFGNFGNFKIFLSWEPGQQKVREHGSGALRKWQTKLRKWCKLGKKEKEKEKKKKEKRQKGNEETIGKEKEEGEGKKWKDEED